ncbi:MAG: CpsD/CapB family tyrosine-protein kinase [Myxococcales bacterium]|nr:CpsD/CapB family tyrosine-protein kinase [Myxococcales bacterium]
MTTPKRPPGRFGDAPSSPERRGAPLPLLTQPMLPIVDHDGPDQTRVDNALGQVKPETAAVLFGRSTVAMTVQPKASLAPTSHPSLAPPEIGLTQHALPDEEPDRRLTLMIDPDSERAAAFRVLRHHLLELGRPQCVVVSSPRQGDGKTTTATNLALALAECGRAKVLLVETHLRRPQLAAVFKLVPPWCFAEQLAAHRHQPMMPWSVVDIPQLWLHVAAINPRIEQTQLLDGPAFAIAMERLRLGGYDHIVIDAPPVLGSADVNLMADAADAVILALRARVTTTRDLRKAIDQLGAAKVVGTVLVQ